MKTASQSRQQVIRFVRLEALNWCKTAIPVGLIAGTVITWAVCALLRYGIGGEFASTPVFAISPIGLVSGAVVGLVTVLLAAQAPAKRAAKVSPMAAASSDIKSDEGEELDHVNLTSYTDYLLDSAEDSVVEGNLSDVYGNTGSVMTISNKDNPLQVGDRIRIGGKEVTITCAVSSGVFPSEYSVICSEETFEWLTGETAYSLIGIKLDSGATDETIRQINDMAGSDIIFSDLRKGNQEDKATYFAARFVLYSFLAIIAMITLFNMINSISMSVTARIRQYGAMRAVGMDGGQLTNMVIAEALTYAASGLVVGCAAGLALSRYLHIMLITKYFGTAWSLPVPLLCIIAAFDLFAALLAARTPSRRIRNMPITETINEL